MVQSDKEILTKIAHTVRALSADAIEKQSSGHPGLPLGAAELGAFLFTRVLKYNPENPQWIARDRFILSAGHGSMFQYALLHLSGYDLTIEEIKNFRLLHSQTPGHPEFGETPGVETTTGPLGQGVAVATGMAIAQKWLSARFSADLFPNKIWVLAGDGCMMEGVSSEASSLAGTLQLNNLVIMYDANDICLDGPIDECFREDIIKRYQAYNFNVLDIDGYDFEQMEQAFASAREEQHRPTLIVVRTIIGKHCPNRQGKNISHGRFLGPEEMALFKKEIGWPADKTFYIPAEVKEYFDKLQPCLQEYEHEWNKAWLNFKTENPQYAGLFEQFRTRTLPDDFRQHVWDMPITADQPTRKYNEALVQKIAGIVPFLVSGSADVSSVDFTWLLNGGIVAAGDWKHQQIKFGVREFAMAGCATGMHLYGLMQPVIGTFLVFSDYMRNAIRMSALMKQHVIYVFSHDSILIGQDGPTHQPVEHLMSLRLIPGLTMIRPGDENEAKMAWITAMEMTGQPVALCFTRQPVKSTVSDLTRQRAKDGLEKGAYLLYGREQGMVDVEIFASGSEIHAAVFAARRLQKEDYSVRVISVPSWELFDKQDSSYKENILSGQARYQVSVEAGRGLGWQKFVGRKGLIISQETYGASAPEPDMADHFGFTGEKVYLKIRGFITENGKN